MFSTLLVVVLLLTLCLPLYVSHRQVAGGSLQLFDTLAQGALHNKPNTDCYQTTQHKMSKYPLKNTPSRHHGHHMNHIATANTHKNHRHSAVMVLCLPALGHISVTIK